ncbi:hypothetical protein [Mucilaginibacter pedocola]|uniref:Uncharacterized protein n=1 Tax=Mucilaginibacter pedocola TaxID=1792845 RepID=A0A1S9PHF9_9SPHI|nr:hypothetical protein [Mucilaginibacter pedocola]OOQ59988.1 hypothetical protein BC343_27035 [Mucilaginibacter pedocola]
MLKDELARLKRLAAEGEASPFAGECIRIAEAWQRAAFSDAGGEALQRYFRFHLIGLSELSSACASGEMQGGLIRLLSGLCRYYPVFFDHDVAAPKLFIDHIVLECAGAHAQLADSLANGPWPQSLGTCLLSYLDSVRAADSMAYGAIGYYRYFLETLAGVRCEKRMRSMLIEMNFNHLGYFASLQASWNDSTDLRGTLANYAGQPVQSRYIYHPGWPSLKSMACGWLEEAVKLSCRPELPAPKLPLNLSVAHLAYLARLFQEEGLLGNTPLNTIFKFLSANYTTKRQPAISPGSLSKEYYSTSQQSAARVRGLLQAMLARVNRAYFPVLVLIDLMLFYQ